MLLRALPVALVLLIAAPASASSLPGIPKCGSSAYGATVKPRTWSSGCTGSSWNVERLMWSSWGRLSASGKGVDRYNDCDPSCADGTTTSYPATLKLSRPRLCYTQEGKRIRVFTRLKYTTEAPGSRPSGTFELTCLRKSQVS